jgi:hypothetical protein
MNTVTKQIEDNIIAVLIRLYNEAHVTNCSADEFGERGLAISQILELVERDFGIDYMIKIFIMTSKKIGHTLSPLDLSIVRKLESNGFEINNISKAVEYKK